VGYAGKNPRQIKPGMLENYLSDRLQKRGKEGLYRELKTESTLTDFCSNDYLGLACSGKLFDLIHQRIESLHIKQNGATGSRLLSGNSDYYEQVEHSLATRFRSESSLIFNSGYSANLAVLSSIPQRGDTILYDELAHACIKDGARLSLATRHSFRHNDLHDLEQKLKKSGGRKYIAIESIYSMDGDEAPLRDVVRLAEKFDAAIILDEAHSTGVMGADGSGFAVKQELHHKVDIRIYTFGKAMGVHGACVCGSKNLTSYLINFARPFIYTTALSPHSVCAIACAFDFLTENISLQNQLESNIQFFLNATAGIKHRTSSNSAIQTVITPGNDRAKKAAHHLQESGFDIRPILSPTVQVGTERLRICLHSYNTIAELSSLSDALLKLDAHL
jgi:8-amino-7-oxononanoate synthase